MRETGGRKRREVLTPALNGDAALQGQPLRLPWFFKSVFNPIFVTGNSYSHNPPACHGGGAAEQTCASVSAETGRRCVTGGGVLTDGHYEGVNSRD